MAAPTNSCGTTSPVSIPLWTTGWSWRDTERSWGVRGSTWVTVNFASSAFLLPADGGSSSIRTCGERSDVTQALEIGLESANAATANDLRELWLNVRSSMKRDSNVH